MPSRRQFITEVTFTPDVRQWKRIARRARKNGLSAIYWWVVARDGAGVESSSEVRTLIKLHENVRTTIFWVGEAASADNGFIPNDDSAWDECWKERYGGIDDPFDRDGFLPSAFAPADNPFYVALPYNDLDRNGEHKRNVLKTVPWAQEPISPDESVVKNRWVKIIHDGHVCYGQWEDVGPFRENDRSSVFRGRELKRRAGLDVSPALATCLNIPFDVTPTSWRFVDEGKVPAGPWRDIVTTSQLNFDPPSCP
ncbi:MAG: hypothetical protein ACE5I7_15365 [Candidatus Binatia bacterium]